MAHVTDYDVWHISEEPVTVEMVVETLHRNTERAQQALRSLVLSLSPDRACSCGQALANAVITSPERIPSEARQRLGLLVDKYLK
jgi:5'-methylthioadenosine phosphorylase